MMIQRILLNGGLLLFFSKAGQQLLRLLAALLICVAMLVFTTRAAPFRRLHHDYLSIICNLALTCMYIGAIYCRFFDSVSAVLTTSQVEDILGLASADPFASIMLVFFFLTFLCLLLLLLQQATADVGVQILRCEDGTPPELTLQPGHRWHGRVAQLP